MPTTHARQQYIRAKQDVAADRAAVRSVRFRLFLIPILTCLFAFSPTLLHAQIDLCSLSGGIVLEAGVNHSVLVKVPAGTKIEMELLRECEPKRDFTSYSGLYLTGPDYVHAKTWETGPENDNPSAMPLIYAFPATPDDMEIQVELDACPGTRVRIKCI